MITRFAPSPTGHLHLGHAFAAKVAHDRARDAGGLFLLRFEDIDHTRVRPEFYEHITEDLHWLGIHWDLTPWKQQERLEAYRIALETLQSLNVVYPCFCTRRDIASELSQLANAPHGPEGPLYPGTCQRLTKDEISEKMRHHEPAWRLNTQKASSIVGDLSFSDRIHGEIPVSPALLGDVILARKDIGTSYHLAVVTDDAAQGITLVTRGEDLLASTHIHRLLQALLQLPEPDYEHHRLIHDDQGERLAKRHDPLSIRSLRQSGTTPEEIFTKLGPI